MATSNTILGPVSLAPRGEYDPAAQYTYLDLVRYNGSGYLVLRSIQGVTPVDGADYMLITERGGIGATGETGPQGEQGIQGVQGEKGETGDPGSSIARIERTAGTGAPGTRDTYTITLTDGSTSSFEVYNGADGIGAGDMTAAVYDPQGKAQDIFKFVADHTQPDAVTVAGGGKIEMEESLGEGPHTFEFTADDETAVSAAQVSYDGAASGLEAETVQGALDRLSAIKVDVGRVSNANLLHNGYFVDPINQRGQKEYAVDGYAIDRWYVYGGTLTLTSGKITYTPRVEAVGIFQNIDSPENYRGKRLTFSCKLASGPAYLLLQVNNSIRIAEKIINEPCGFISGIVPENTTQLSAFIFSSETTPFSLEATKLELGPVQTLAHKDASGNWVLNDPPPDPTLELAKCQSYQEKVTSMRTGNSTLGGYVAVGGEYNRLLFAEPIPFKIRKRVMPIIKDVILVPILDNGTATTEMRPTIDWSYCTEDALFQCAVSSQYAIESGRKYYISFLADANL